MEKQEKITSQFELMLLALISQQPRSGYEIRKVLVTTPMAHYSDSPGSVYPALKRMEKRGVVRSEEESVGQRKRQRYACTSKGNSALKQWLTKSVTRADVMYNLDELLLRFAFMQPLSRRETLAFLTDLAQHLEEHVIELKKFFAGVKKAMPITGRLAMESGIESYETTLRWARRANKELASL